MKLRKENKAHSVNDENFHLLDFDPLTLQDLGVSMLETPPHMRKSPYGPPFEDDFDDVTSSQIRAVNVEAEKDSLEAWQNSLQAEKMEIEQAKKELELAKKQVENDRKEVEDCKRKNTMLSINVK